VLGASDFVVVAGPCAIESLERFDTIATAVGRSGATILRGGIHKLRTRPDTFQGLGDPAIAIVREVRARTGMPFVTEITDARQVEALDPVVDAYQVGSRNMHNYALLKELGRAGKPVILKRGFCGRIDEWLHAAEYLVRAGTEDVVLCERGIRTFETAMRNTLDLAAVPYVKERVPFPVLVDPSHGTGRPSLISPMALAAAAAGADGVMVEVHDDPKAALSDGEQALTPAMFDELVARLEPVLAAVRRPLARAKEPR
jgi:3-deoxy-7-phosphoheptulonate synthase